MLNELDIIVDVGAEYDFSRLRLDHHQNTFSEYWNKECPKIGDIKLSSAGLVYRHFGKDFIRSMTKQIYDQDLTEAQIDYLYPLLYKKLILEIDAIDNGVSEAKEMKYMVGSGLASRVGRLNPDWESTDKEAQHTQFKKAMVIAEEELVWKIKELTQTRLKVYEYVKGAFEKKEQFHPSGELMCLEKGCMWKGPLFELEEEFGQQGKVKFVLYPDQRQQWRIQTVPPSEGSFDQRVSLKKEWRGVRDQELGSVSGIEDAIFVHASGFIGGAVSQASCIRMALESIEAA